jgi:hypothetical protein
MLNNSHILHQTQHDLKERGIDGRSLTSVFISLSTAFRTDHKFSAPSSIYDLLMQTTEVLPPSI